MAATKCVKCGTNIPDGATFCPACGAPKAAEQPAAQQAQPQPMQPMSPRVPSGTSPLEGLFDMAFSKTAIIIGVSIGILLSWIAVLISAFSPGSTNVALLLSSMGFAGMGLLLVGGGVWSKKVNPYVRIAMVLIGGFLIANGCL